MAGGCGGSAGGTDALGPLLQLRSPSAASALDTDTLLSSLADGGEWGCDDGREREPRQEQEVKLWNDPLILPREEGGGEGGRKEGGRREGEGEDEEEEDSNI